MPSCALSALPDGMTTLDTVGGMYILVYANYPCRFGAREQRATR